jgi:transposase-like protein
MTNDHRRADTRMAQEALLDDPSFFKEILQRVIQELLEAEMTEHIGAAPYERAEKRTGHRNGHKPRTLRTRVAAPSTCWCLRTGKGRSPPGSLCATKGTRRRCVWP